MGTQRSCGTWHERGRAREDTAIAETSGASPEEDGEIILAARGRGRVGRGGLGFCPPSLEYLGQYGSRHEIPSLLLRRNTLQARSGVPQQPFCQWKCLCYPVNRLLTLETDLQLHE